MMLAELGYNIGPIIASAGILGVALGFGAQSLVKDFLSGIFMIFEDQYGVGDVVDLGEASGTVEAVSLRVTRLRDVNGTVWYVRNGEILRVGNMSQNWARTVLDVGVAYREDLAGSAAVLRRSPTTCGRTRTTSGVIIEEPEVWGVEALDPDGVTSGCAQDRAAGAVGGRPRDARSGSRPASTTRASRSRSRSGWSGTATAAADGAAAPTTRGPAQPASDAAARSSAQASAASSVIVVPVERLATPGSSPWRPRRRRRSPRCSCRRRCRDGQPDPGDARCPGWKSTSALVSSAWAACRPWPARWTGPSRSRRSAPRRSAPRGWSCRWPPRRARPRRRRTCRARGLEGHLAGALEQGAFPVGRRGAGGRHARSLLRSSVGRVRVFQPMPGLRTIGRMRTAPTEQTFYDEIGGYETFARSSPASTRACADDQVLRPLYPEEDLGPAEERFRLFLVQYWGGPTTYSDDPRPPAAADAARAVRGHADGQGALAARTSAPASTRSG